MYIITTRGGDKSIEPNPWCDVCQCRHGKLYICEYYSDEKKAELAKASAKYSTDLTDPDWIKRQLDRGVPPETIAIFQAMAGVK